MKSMTSRFEHTHTTDLETHSPTPGKLLTLRERLESVFDTSLTVWQRSTTGQWRVAERPVGVPQVMVSTEDWAGQYYAWLDSLPIPSLSDQEQLQPHFWAAPVDSSLTCLAVLWSEEGESPYVIGGAVSLSGQHLAHAAANFAINQMQREDEQKMLEHYALRLSASFEELCFLRRLSKHVDYCVVDRTPAEVAEAILPDLRHLLEVESLCFVEAGIEPETQSVLPLGIAQQVGRLPITESECLEMVHQYAFNGQRVVVRNYLNNLGLQGEPHPRGVRSLVLTAVEKEGQVFGWMLGFNKRGPDVSPTESLNSLGHDEIGSMEATLLEASAMMLGSHGSNHRLFEDMESLVVGIIHSLVGAIEARDAYTSGHSDRVAMMARRLAQQLGLNSEDCEDIFLCGLLHDVGKIGVPDEILQKPGRLTEAEFAEIKKHPVIGEKILRGLKPLKKLLPGVLHHHESMDGTGYPHQLKGQQIPLMARILAVADAFDAMTSDRPYRDGMPMDRAASILREGSGSQWDPQVVAAFFAAQTDIESICQHGGQKNTPAPTVPVTANAAFQSQASHTPLTGQSR